jgi:hypothetical protein
MGPEQAALADALRQLPPHDQRLARSLRDAPTVLGAAGFNFATDNTRDGMRTTPLRDEGGDAVPFLYRFPFVLTSLPELQAAAHGQGLNDRRVTPLGESVAGIEIQAQLLKSLLDGRMLLRPWWMPGAELTVLLVVGLAMIVWIPGALARHDAQGVRTPRRVGFWVAAFCLLDDFVYTVQRLQLEPGGDLVMVTDGITEAANSDQELYGNTRLQAALATSGDGASVDAILRHLREAVAVFVEGAEASDDMAVLVLRWNEPGVGA